ncbi:AAR116Wp [Eremothecium gossypii ATCC 10895]|uniref:Small nuclear ribonucleoprotein E n=1 Tax=Eremothecium gossypii (strain ATCC 10895 / CBS 109.51 / FGSC 9923 / NRRL Y-1056) TaxID=284811 RepID=Q75EU5_EREGS|nr:AAR116Wp [Eremothecium gossypii ATCC 10895]AAS50482.1 AAR116Wp [Eremothecium gossypii ATCC 10895]AEY94769.1 FAAR116Wp [Eremothecium gossypii FDAG1]
MSGKQQKPMMPPINCIYNYLQQQTTVTFWLFQQTQMRIKGRISGFDEFMNVVVDEAVEVPVDEKSGEEQVGRSTRLGRILLKGDNITLITAAEEEGV